MDLFFFAGWKKGFCRINWAVPVFIWSEVEVGSRGALIDAEHVLGGRLRVADLVRCYHSI